MRAVALLLILGGVTAQLTPVPAVVNKNIEKVNPPSFVDSKDVSAAFHMSCASTSFIGDGVFNLDAFMDAVRTAFNEISKEKRSQWGDQVTDAEFKISEADSSKYLRVDRFVEKTRQNGNVVQEKISTPTQTVPIATYWNAYLRFTVLGVPEDVADDFYRVITKLFSTYNQCQIQWDSLWISTEIGFITDRLEDVPGRGAKDQKLLIPLIIGVTCMLVCPAICTSIAVFAQKKKNRSKRQLREKERVIEISKQELSSRAALIEQFQEKEQEMEVIRQKEKEARIRREEEELSDEDVDWSKRPLVGGDTSPYGSRSPYEHDA